MQSSPPALLDLFHKDPLAIRKLVCEQDDILRPLGFEVVLGDNVISEDQTFVCIFLDIQFWK